MQQLDSNLSFALRERVNSVAAHLMPNRGRSDECRRIVDMMINDAESNDIPHLFALPIILKSYTHNHQYEYQKVMGYGMEALKLSCKTGDQYVLQKALSMVISATRDYGFSMNPNLKAAH